MTDGESNKLSKYPYGYPTNRVKMWVKRALRSSCSQGSTYSEGLQVLCTKKLVSPVHRYVVATKDEVVALEITHMNVQTVGDTVFALLPGHPGANNVNIDVDTVLAFGVISFLATRRPVSSHIVDGWFGSIEDNHDFSSLYWWLSSWYWIQAVWSTIFK